MTQPEPRHAGAPSVLRLEALPDPGLFRETLSRAGYTEEGIRGLKAYAEPGVPMDLEGVIERTSGSTPFDTLARLFFLGQPARTGEVHAALSPLGVSPLIDVGLLIQDGDFVRAAARIMFADGLLMIHDFGPRLTRRRVGEDHVLGVGAATTLVTSMSVRRSGDVVLDLGTGQGFQALVASRHASRVIGTDVNPRALSCAELSRRMNGIGNVEFRSGSLFEPVKADPGVFDLIACNPPFLISPGDAPVAVRGELEGNTVAERVVREAPAHLGENGRASIACDWPHTGAADWDTGPRRWIEGRGCDAWIVRLKTRDAREYAREWLYELSEGVPELDESSGPALDTWMRYYERAGIGAVSFGVICLRKRQVANWVRADAIDAEPRPGPIAAQVARIFDNQTLLAGGANAVLGAALSLTPTIDVEQRIRPRDGGGWRLASVTLRQTAGFEMPIGVSGEVLDLIGRLDGKRSLREVASESARAAGAAPEAVMPQIAAIATRLVALGHLAITK